MGKVEDFMNTETFKKAEEISRRSITEMVEMQEKAEKYDKILPYLQELIFKFREDKSLGSYDIHLYELIESVINQEDRK